MSILATEIFASRSERRDVGRRHARDQVELAGLELRDARGIVRDLLAHDARPRLLAAPVAVETFGDEVALRCPRDELVRSGADRGLAGVEHLVGILLRDAGRGLVRYDE